MDKNLNYNKIYLNKPAIFEKKASKSPVKYQKYINSDTGQTKHFTPAAQEWYNNIYAYNTNYIKLLPIADRNLLSLLKSYFNFRLKDKLINKRKGTYNIYRRLSVNKIFVGRGDLKHTNSKVIITFFVHNVEKRMLFLEKQKIARDLLYPNILLKKRVNFDEKGNQVVTYNRYFSIDELKTWSNMYELYYSYLTKLVSKLTLYLALLIKYYDTLTKLVETKILTEHEKLAIFNNKIHSIHTVKYPDFNLFVLRIIYIYKQTLRRFRYLVYFNNIKFKESFIWELSRLANKIYNKEIEFNIVNLKKMHLNTDIFTQAVSLKLRNRSNKLFKVLRSSLSKIKLPNVRRISKDTGLNRDKYLINKIRNSKINSMFLYNDKRDSLENLLLNFYPSTNNLKIGYKNLPHIVRDSVSLENYVLKFLKHTKISGIRIEAKGRLTKRFTASRSVFKMKWKGGLKNVNSSFRGLSSIMLRGHVKSNIQYSMLNSKNRNGAFGIKGWIANK